MEQLINFIIRPPRAEYDPREDLLDQKFRLKGKLYKRKDLEVVNNRGEVLQCSHYMPDICPEETPLPCVIYCHGNSGCRMDASEAAVILLPLNITVFCFDFSGSGLSGGEHVTLGWNEKADLRSVVDYQREDGKVSMIGLWGRSMGAVTSLMYAAEDPSIAGMVIDSPFSDLIDLMMELVDSYKVRLPKFTVKFLIQYIRRAIQKKVKFDIVDLNTVKAAESCFVPALFGHAIEDDFIRPHHSDLIFDAYAGDKNIIRFEGDHNSPRPQFYFDSISIFFNNVLHPPPDDELAPLYIDLNEDTWGSVPDLEDIDGLPGPTDGAAAAAATATANSTDDAMEQIRSKKSVENKTSDSSPSSSNVFASEPSKGSSHHGSNMADFPINVEEEERMIVEAVVESLKDLERRNPHEESSPDGPGDLPKLISAPMNGQEDPEPDFTSNTSAEAALHSREDDNSTASLLPSDKQSTIDMEGRSSVTSEDDKNPTGGCDGQCLTGCWDLSFFRNK